MKTDGCTDSSFIPLKGECINNINKLHDYNYAPINVKPHYQIYGLRSRKVGICTLAKYKSAPMAPTMKCLHFVKNDRRDCILVSCNMYNDKSSLPVGRLMVDSPTFPHPQPVYVVVGHYIDRCIIL